MLKCPECGGALARCLPNSGFGQEFYRCEECAATVHELGRPEDFVAPAEEPEPSHPRDLLGPTQVGHKCPSCGDGVMLAGVPGQSFGEEFIRCSRCSYTVHEAGLPSEEEVPGVFETLGAGARETGRDSGLRPDPLWERPPPRVELVRYRREDYLVWKELDQGQTMIGLPEEVGESVVQTKAGEWEGAEPLRALPRGFHLRSTRELDPEAVAADYRFEVAELYWKLLRRKLPHPHLWQPLSTAAQFVDSRGESPPPTAFESLIFPATGRLLPEAQYLTALVLEIAEVPLLNSPEGRLHRLKEVGRSPGAVTYVTGDRLDEEARLRLSNEELVILSAFLGPYRLRAFNG